MNLQQLVDLINSYVWSTPLVLLCLGTGIYFSIRTRFLQVRLIKDMVGQLFRGRASKSGISSFQGFAMALGGRVGTGNIAGVATAIGVGGPGALFWMWMIAFLGAGSAYIEAALGQVWKEKIGGVYRGGPSYYIDKGLGQKWYSIIFAVVTIISCGILLPGVQANSIASAFQGAYPVLTPAISGAIIVVLLGLIIFGGVKRIGRTAELLVPFMAVAYVLMALVIVAIDYKRIPAVFSLIVSSALGKHAAFGGIVGSAIAWGVKRGIYSNEAGQGTGPQAAAAAEVAHPAQQGLVQAFSVYVDTLFVCSATGFMILITGMYNTGDGKGGYLVHNLPGVEAGPAWTQSAIDTIFKGYGAQFVAIALFFFAFTTLMAYAFYTESNVAYLFKKKSTLAITLARVFLLAMTFYGAVRTANLAWGMGDIGVGLMAWLNIIAILLLSKVGLATLKDYEAQRKSGQPLRFDPGKLGIGNAVLWMQINEQQQKQRETTDDL
ncbi:MAG: alanine:cation symporter family protein [Candidatus Aminicenantes bacterium]|nr:alanine:cation symporter family protein [Acidobacteriota bacterium]MCG2812306.1 alanine:cation symporter family protein [Candidatus Aminicenantes bacterium]